MLLIPPCRSTPAHKYNATHESNVCRCCQSETLTVGFEEHAGGERLADVVVGGVAGERLVDVGARDGRQVEHTAQHAARCHHVRVAQQRRTAPPRQRRRRTTYKLELLIYAIVLVA